MYGGPFTHEVDAIRDERNRAAVMGEKPNFRRLFKDVDLSDGAKEILKDIARPVDEQEFIPHDYSHEPTKNVVHEEKEEEVVKEEDPTEGTGKEEPSEGDKGKTPDSSQQDTASVGALEKILEGQDK